MNHWNKRVTKVLLSGCLVLATAWAQADDRINVRIGWSSPGGLEWQLGQALGWNRGHEILYRNRGSGRWYVAPGAATALGDGWVLGNDWQRGGWGIYRWNGRDWNRMPGAAVRIGGSYRSPWVINDRGVRYEWNGNDWREDRGRGNGYRDRDDDRDRWGNNRRGRDRDDRDRRDRRR